MSKIKYIDIKEFCNEGYLQEANRIFFHPHGLALVVTVVDENGWGADTKTDVEDELVAEVLKILEDRFESLVESEILKETAIEILNSLYPPGYEYINGVWDERDDPEGIWFDFRNANDYADKPLDPWSKYQRVLTERNKHSDHRSKMFTEAYGRPTGDIEPIVIEGENGS